MPIKADMKYNGKIAEGSYFSYSMNGNLAFNICLECEDGNTKFILWLTEKNKAKVVKTLTDLGADPEKLSNQNYLDFELAKIITGKEVSFGTKEDTYNGKTSIKVSWIGKKTDPNVAKGAATFFRGGASVAPATPQGKFTDEGIPIIDESDIPF